MRITRLFTEFFNSEKASGFILIACTAFSLLVTNSSLGAGYQAFWHIQFAGHSLTHWINDGLMTIFFLLVGLEIEREIYDGELKSLRNALLPVLAAAGGMLVPALMHLSLNYGTSTQNGFGIPMATDIAFALGVLSLAGKKVPGSLKVFLTALAIIDDLGAILIIAFFYTSNLSGTYLFFAALIFGGLIILNKLKIHNLWAYLIPGVFMWYFMLQSGVHATISGVLLAFAMPFGDGSQKTVSWKTQHFLHKPVAFIIIPLFALANTCIVFSGDFYSGLTETNSLGIIAGLFLGKPIGIVFFSWLAVKTKLVRLQSGVKWAHIVGAGILGGIGFTMSIFISLLAFPDEDIIIHSKIAILFSSLLAGIIGLIVLKLISKPRNSLRIT
ncbi:MAG TPA: Na+/H+ antiporter NhaA [Chitinophagaceae bacterium]|nr:Na+/H+ antiporter NhaA [Chitinophagaceae bacterium]